MDDPRTLNKQLLIRPEPNIKSMNEVVQLWEKKIGHSLDKTYIPESEVLKQIEGKRKRRKSPLSRPFLEITSFVCSALYVCLVQTL